MENITKDILSCLGNTHTKVELKEDFKGNYYSYFTDTIYIAKDFATQKIPSAVKSVNKKAAELIVVCHECIHSIQNKIMHILNTVFSNLSIILAIVCIFVAVFWTSSLWLKLIASTVITTSIIIRLILEIGAINGSVKLAESVVEKGIVKGVSKLNIETSINYIKSYKCLALFRMVLDKIIFLVLVIFIK